MLDFNFGASNHARDQYAILWCDFYAALQKCNANCGAYRKNSVVSPQTWSREPSPTLDGD